MALWTTLPLPLPTMLEVAVIRVPWEYLPVPVVSRTAKRSPLALLAVPSLVTVRQVPVMVPAPSDETWGRVLPEVAMVPARSATWSLPLLVVLPRPSVLGLLALPPKTVVSDSVAAFLPKRGTTPPLMPRAVPLPPALPVTTWTLPWALTRPVAERARTRMDLANIFEEWIFGSTKEIL